MNAETPSTAMRVAYWQAWLDQHHDVPDWMRIAVADYLLELCNTAERRTAC